MDSVVPFPKDLSVLQRKRNSIERDDTGNNYNSSDLDEITTLFSSIAKINPLVRFYRQVALDEDTLRNNYVLFLCIHLNDYFEHDTFDTLVPEYLIEACSELYIARDDFEMVLLVRMMDEETNSKTVHEPFLRRVPLWCLLLPFKERKLQCHVCKCHATDAPASFHCLLVNVKRGIMVKGDTNVSQRLQELLRESEMDLERSFPRLQPSIWPLPLEEQEIPWEARPCPILIKLGDVIPEYPDDICNMVSESKKLFPIVAETDKTFNVTLLLSGGKGDVKSYLDRIDGGRVAVDKTTFRGKYIMVCCFHVPILRDYFELRYLQALITTCCDLYSTRKDFEMVVVAKMNKCADYKVVFDHFLSGFPPSCLVVPFEDLERRDFICRFLDLLSHRHIQCVLFNVDNNMDMGNDMDIKRDILRFGEIRFARYHGADAFPFSYEKLKEVIANDTPRWESVSTSTLVGLLGCNAYDVLEKISPNPAGSGEEVMTISELSKKNVGLYLCAKGDYLAMLCDIYEKCRTRKLAFEIVLVYLPFDQPITPQAWMENVNTLLQKHKISSSWWRLPYNNSVTCRLRRLTFPRHRDRLIIVGAHDEFVEPFGEKVMKKHGIDAYPFFREYLIEKELNKLKDLTFESLFASGPKDFFYQGTDKKFLSDLQGKNILLYLEYPGDLCIFPQQLRWYEQLKKNNPDFEVVFVCRSNYSADIEINDSDLCRIMPDWLLYPFDPTHSASVEKRLGFNNATALVEFGENGQLCSLSALRRLDVYGPENFTFGASHLREDVLYRLGLKPIVYDAPGEFY